MLHPIQRRLPTNWVWVYLAPGFSHHRRRRHRRGLESLFNAVIRGDVAAIRIGQRSNIQDGAVLHVDRGTPCIVGDEVTTTAAIVHGTTVGDGVTIGMGAVVLSRLRLALRRCRRRGVGAGGSHRHLCT